MQNLLELLPQGENSLIAAYQAVVDGEGSVDDNDLTKAYEQHFATAVPPASQQAPLFERVSLVDPSIRTIVRSTTAAVS